MPVSFCDFIAPHHVPKEWIEKYRGKFDGGWDKLREETLVRQIKLGVVPAGTKLAPKPEAIKDWDKLSADEKRLFARQMEVYAAFGEHTDYEIGRLIEGIASTGQLDNTLIFYILGDNGTSAEGGMNGLYNEMTHFNGVPETVPHMLKNIDKWGDPTTGGMGKLFVNGQEVASGRIEKTQANIFSADEGTDVGLDEGTAVSSSYSIPFNFTGRIHKVTVDLKPMTTADAVAEKARRPNAIRFETP